MITDESSGELERTESGRPLRRAAAQMKKKLDELDEIDHELAEELDEENEVVNGDEEAEESTGPKKVRNRPVGALTRTLGATSQGLHKRKIVYVGVAPMC